MSRFPFTMSHPAYRKAEIRGGDLASGALPGRPDFMPPVTVHTEDQEEMYRAKGYAAPDDKGPPMIAYAEYPKMMTHPDHADQVPDTQDARMVDGKVQYFTVRGTPERFPHVTVSNAADEAAWTEKGYVLPGKSDAAAFETAIVAPVPHGYEPAQYPMMVDGVLIQDPNAHAASREYPKWIGDAETGTTVADAAEERVERAKRGLPMMAPPEPVVETVKALPDASADEWAAFQAWKAAQADPVEARGSSHDEPVVKRKGGRPKKAKPATEETTDAVQ